MANDFRSADDPYDLNRFVRAQEDDYERALAEIVSGRKRTHWMWYIFPQIDGLAFSSTQALRHQGVEEASGTRSPRPRTEATGVRGGGRSPRRSIGDRDLRLPRRLEIEFVRDTVCVRAATRLGVRPSARKVLWG